MPLPTTGLFLALSRLDVNAALHIGHCAPTLRAANIVNARVAKIRFILEGVVFERIIRRNHEINYDSSHTYI